MALHHYKVLSRQGMQREPINTKSSTCPGLKDFRANRTACKSKAAPRAGVSDIRYSPL